MLLTPVSQADTARIAVVIDDLGFQPVQDRAALALDPRLSVAVIPGTPGARALARQASEQQRDVLIHLPLSGMSGDDCDSGLLECLDPDWPREAIDRYLDRALYDVPTAIGINNHQGSRFTANPAAVDGLVQGLVRLTERENRPLLVLDSRTTPDTRLEHRSQQAGLPTLRRHVFIDHVDDEAAMAQAWQDLLARARRDGSAVGIAHPRRTTLAFLTEAIEGLAGGDVELVPLSALLPYPYPVALRRGGSVTGP
ncbi:MAG: divergent polysaccharide deacetylase family protein [Wenzhouxiangella sp.]